MFQAGFSHFIDILGRMELNRAISNVIVQIQSDLGSLIGKSVWIYIYFLSVFLWFNGKALRKGNMAAGMYVAGSNGADCV